MRACPPHIETGFLKLRVFRECPSGPTGRVGASGRKHISVGRLRPPGLRVRDRVSGALNGTPGGSIGGAAPVARRERNHLFFSGSLNALPSSTIRETDCFTVLRTPAAARPASLLEFSRIRASNCSSVRPLTSMPRAWARLLRLRITFFFPALILPPKSQISLQGPTPPTRNR